MAFKCVLAPQNWTEDDATLTASSEASAWPVENLLLDQPRERFQTAGGTADVQIDITTPEEREITAVAPMFSNIHNQHASWRLRIAHMGEIATPWLDTADIFGMGSAPHLYAVRFVAGDRIDSGTSFTMTSSFCLEAIVRVWAQAAEQTIFKTLPDGTGVHFYLDVDRKLHFDFPGKVTAVTAESLDVFGWAHVAVAYDAAGSTVKLYLNGTLVDTTASVTSPCGLASTADYEIVPPGLDIAELRGWTSARSDAAILATAFSPIADQAGLALYIKLDEGSGTSLADTHSGGPGGTLTGGRWIWPERFWASPGLEYRDRTHALLCAGSRTPDFMSLGGLAAHVRIDIRDEDRDEDAISLGGLVLSAARQPERNHSYGSAPFGVFDPGSRETARSGVTHIVRGSGVGSRPLLFESTSRDEWFQTWHPFLFGLANSRPFLFVSDPLDPYYRHHGMSYGVFDGPLIPIETDYNLLRLRTSMLELT